MKRVKICLAVALLIAVMLSCSGCTLKDFAFFMRNASSLLDRSEISIPSPSALPTNETLTPPSAETTLTELPAIPVPAVVYEPNAEATKETSSPEKPSDPVTMTNEGEILLPLAP